MTLRILPLIATVLVAPTSAALASQPAFSSIENGSAAFAGQQRVVVIFQTDHVLPRRSDGAIEARGSLSHHPGSSISTVGSRSSRCYEFTVPVRHGRFDPAYGHATGARALGGSRHRLEIDATTGDGPVAATRTIMLRSRAAGAPSRCG